MSWNNQGGGPWRSPGRGPWGQGPSGPPTGDLEEIIRRVQEALGRLAPGGKGSSGPGGGLSGRTIAFVVLAAILVWFAWGTFYTVQPNEVGINLVFGRYTGKTAAGLNTNWPWPIGSVIKVPVWDQQITEVGYRSDANLDMPEESQMLTGDKNIVDVHFRVNWQIDPAKPEDYVFNILSPRETVKAVAESIMREVVGLKTIDGILTTDRTSVEADVQKRMQNVLNDYHAGVLVKQVQLQSVDAPSAGHLRLSRRHRRAAGPAARGQRSRNLRQQGRARSRRRRVAHHRRGQRLSRADHPRRQGPDAALQSDLRAIQEGAGGDARAHVSRDDGARARADGQDDRRHQRASPPVPYIALDPLQPKAAGAAK